ncbi:MAG: hypothetical protein NUW01_19540, partial [Gemmatimonadaceae bacterium]|nr:hypothetical protein [Gemmatimonadaceae bacterium]
LRILVARSRDNELRILVARSRDKILGWTKSRHERCDWNSIERRGVSTVRPRPEDGRDRHAEGVVDGDVSDETCVAGRAQRA